MERLIKGKFKLAKYNRYINYFMTLVELKGNIYILYHTFLEEDREAAMTLKGYLNHHSEFCYLDDCPLRNFRKQMLKDLKKNGGESGMNQFGQSLVQQVSVHSGAS